MSKWRKKPIVIEATKWMLMGDHPNVANHNDCFYVARHEICPECGHELGYHGMISTLEDVMAVAHRVCPGDWIITGVKGEQYACKPDIFEATYEAVEQTEGGGE
jgi:hypothetical protein